MALLDDEGNIKERYEYSAYGEPRITPILDSGQWPTDATITYAAGTTTITGTFNADSGWAGRTIRFVYGDSTGEMRITSVTSASQFAVLGEISSEPSDGTPWEVTGLVAYDVTGVSYDMGSDTTTLTFAIAPLLEDQNSSAGDDELMRPCKGFPAPVHFPLAVCFARGSDPDPGWWRMT